jgi:cytochrome bd-type quinol oxidase subunit 2
MSGKKPARVAIGVAIAFFALALGAAWAASQTGEGDIQQRWAALMATSLGLSLVLWGISELATGKALVHRRRAAREERPITFWIVIVVFRFLVGAVLVLAGLWRLL